MSAIFWLVAMMVFLVVEAGTISLVSLWFAGGSLVAMVVALCSGPLWLQILVFLAVSGALLGLLRPLTRKFLEPKITPTNVDSIPGMEGYVTTAIDNLAAVGTVKLGAVEWTARSTDGAPIPAGTLVRADRVEGVRVYVTPVPVPAKN